MIFCLRVENAMEKKSNVVGNSVCFTNAWQVNQVNLVLGFT